MLKAAARASADAGATRVDYVADMRAMLRCRARRRARAAAAIRDAKIPCYTRVIRCRAYAAAADGRAAAAADASRYDIVAATRY